VDRAQETATATGRGGIGGVDPTALAAAALLAAAVAWSYFPSLTYLATYWDDPNYSHGWLIVPIALFILWQRRPGLAFVAVRHRWWHFLPLVALLAVRPWLFARNEQWAEAATVPLVVAATVLAVGGWGLLRWSWPALVYLLFMIPLPESLNEKLAYPLQRLATLGSVELLQSLHQPALAEGNVILISKQRVEVAEACRGLSMLLSFGALITAMVILVRRPLGERIALVVSIIPIALACNIIRIAVTAIAYAKFDRPVKAVHDYAGFGMMAMALVFVLIELKVMSWLVVEERDAGPRSPFPGVIGPRKAEPR
jgi:exosortase